MSTQSESAPTTIAKQLLESWKDREYRAEFVRERVRASIALQIRALREQRNGMTQQQLGNAIGMAQTWISRLEDPEYGKMTVATLLRLAGAFDTDLEVKFRPFSRALHELSKQGQEYFEVRGFEDELPELESSIARTSNYSRRLGDLTRAGNPLVPMQKTSSLLNNMAAPPTSGGKQPVLASEPTDLNRQVLGTSKGIHLVPPDAREPAGDKWSSHHGMGRTRRPGRKHLSTRKLYA